MKQCHVEMILGITIMLTIITLLYTLTFFIDTSKEQSTISNKPTTIYGAYLNVPSTQMNELRHYFNNGNAEWLYCFTTNLTNNEMTLNDMWRPVTYNASYNQVTHKPCPSALGTIHPHYNGNCNPSQADWDSMTNQHHSLMGIMCGSNNIAMYDSNTNKLAVFEVP